MHTGRQQGAVPACTHPFTTAPRRRPSMYTSIHDGTKHVRLVRGRWQVAAPAKGARVTRHDATPGNHLVSKPATCGDTTSAVRARRTWGLHNPAAGACGADHRPHSPALVDAQPATVPVLGHNGAQGCLSAKHFSKVPVARDVIRHGHDHAPIEVHLPSRNSNRK
jgi:hypothetical protein